MDYRNSGGFTDKNTVIYGHNMKDGSMFSSLTKYKEQGYYERLPTMALYTPEGDYTIELFAGVVADGDYEFVRFGFIDDADFQDYIHALKEKSTFKSNTRVKADDRIVTLCTCSYEFNNARYALFGRLSLS
jgi:sortase B